MRPMIPFRRGESEKDYFLSAKGRISAEPNAKSGLIRKVATLAFRLCQGIAIACGLL